VGIPDPSAACLPAGRKPTVIEVADYHLITTEGYYSDLCKMPARPIRRVASAIKKYHLI
jgi:hypothetical protein